MAAQHVELTEPEIAAWRELVEVDKLRVCALVDNESDGISTACPCCDPRAETPPTAAYTSEIAGWTQALLDGKLHEWCFTKSMLAGHGLSLLLTAEVGGEQRSILVDGGPREDLWELNATQAQVDLAHGSLGAAVLTHWHCDHSVGLAAVARWASRARQARPQQHHNRTGQQGPADPGSGGAEADARDAGPALPEFVFDVHPDRPHRRGACLRAGQHIPFNPDVELPALQLPGCRVEAHTDAHTLLGGAFLVSGRIPRTTSYEQGNPAHITQREPGGPWEADPLIWDERWVAAKVAGLGAVVFSGCSHAGIVNVVRHAKALAATTGTPLVGVVGGLHLAGRGMEERVPETVADLVAELPARAVVLAGHCTGWRAKAALAAAWPAGFQPCVVGGTYDFAGAGLHSAR